MAGRIPAPGESRRLTRSARERMWAGVAGGMARYFDIDPALVRLVWVAATILTHGAAVLIYIVLWIVIPRDDRVDQPPSRGDWQGWSREFESQTRQFASEARRMAHDMSDELRGPTASASGSAAAPDVEKIWTPVPETTPSTADFPAPSGAPEGTAEGAATHKTTYAPPEPAYVPNPWETPPPYVDHDRVANRQRTAGVILVVLGLLFFAQQSGFFRVQWDMFWPLILVAIGVALLFRRSGWR